MMTFTYRRYFFMPFEGEHEKWGKLALLSDCLTVTDCGVGSGHPQPRACCSRTRTASAGTEKELTHRLASGIHHTSHPGNLHIGGQSAKDILVQVADNLANLGGTVITAAGH